jgi:hypothetical protein
VFLTFNSPEDGDLRDLYYMRMRQLRAEYKLVNTTATTAASIFANLALVESRVAVAVV